MQRHPGEGRDPRQASPEGGDGGGEIVAEGTPEDVAREPRSYTGKYLKPVLARKAKNGGGKRQAAE